MTHTVSPTTAQALKAAGFAQPEPKAGQIWYDYGERYVLVPEFSHGIACCPLDDGIGQPYTQTSSVDVVFMPTLEDITPHLPPTFALEMWGGHPSCANRDEENPLRTLGENFAEAAAEMWLKIQKREL